MARIRTSDKSRDARHAVIPCFRLRTFLTHETELAPYSRLCRPVGLAGPWNLCPGDPSQRFATRLH